MTTAGRVIAVACDLDHGFGKPVRDRIELVAGFGVKGDAHFGRTIQHRSRVASTPEAANLRQVHLLQGELLAEMRDKGFAVAPGEMGENVTTADIDLLALSAGTRLRLGPEAIIEVTGLRNPCRQIDEHIGMGAMAATLARSEDGALLRRAGVMAIVVSGGAVRPGDSIALEYAPETPIPLDPV